MPNDTNTPAGRRLDATGPACAGAVTDADVRRALRAYFADDDEPTTDYEMSSMRAALEADRAALASARPPGAEDARVIDSLQRQLADERSFVSRIAEALGLAPYGGAYNPEAVLPAVQRLAAASARPQGAEETTRYVVVDPTVGIGRKLYATHGEAYGDSFSHQRVACVAVREVDPALAAPAPAPAPVGEEVCVCGHESAEHDARVECLAGPICWCNAYEAAGAPARGAEGAGCVDADGHMFAEHESRYDLRCVRCGIGATDPRLRGAS